MVDVTLTQSQPAEPYKLTVEIGIVSVAGAEPRVARAELAHRQATLSVAAESEPAAVVLDPDTKLLMDAAPFSRETVAALTGGR